MARPGNEPRPDLPTSLAPKANPRLTNGRIPAARSSGNTLARHSCSLKHTEAFDGSEIIEVAAVGLAALPRNPLEDSILIRGARVHNLKNVSLAIPHNQLTVVTGVSGSGKSSLVFDTVYAEGQRRYVESLSAYARQFLERMEKPDVDEIAGIAPPIAIRQKNTTRNPRSTVATSTEIYDFLRLLYARVGRSYCPNCGREVRRDTVDQVAGEMLGETNGSRWYAL